MEDNLFDAENQQMPEGWRDDVKAEDLFEEMFKRRASWHLVNKEDVIGIMEEYHQSKLQALKEEVEGMRNLDTEAFSPQAERNGAFNEVLNLITNLEDK